MDIVTVYSECEVLDRSLNNKPELRQAKILEYLRARKNVKLVKNDELPKAEDLEKIHEAAYLECIREAYPSWRVVDDDDWWANGGVVPNHLPYLSARPKVPPNYPAYKRVAFHASDTMSPINEDTWRNCNLSAMNSLKAAQMLTGGTRFVYALNSSPGHHATADHYGGYCFLNNAALAAESIVAKTTKRVAILDLDYHHGNGQQDIFWDDPNVLTISLHVDPTFDYPSFSGFDSETGGEDAPGSNKNYPLPPDTEDYDYIIALADALKLVKDRQCEYLIVAFGTDTYQGDPDKSNLGGFALTDDVYETLGRMIGGLHLPTMVTQEGGYNLRMVGELTYDFLNGISQQKTQES